MKIAIIAFALVAACSADVSHLNNMYLPPLGASSTLKASVALPQSAEFEAQAEEIPAAIGADTITPAHLAEQSVHTPVFEVTSNTIEEAVVPAAIGADTITPEYLAAAASSVYPGADSSSHTPAHLREETVRPGYDSSSHTPAHLQVETVRPGYDSSSHTPAHLQEETVRPGYDSSSHTPAHLLTAASHEVAQEAAVEHIDAQLPLSADSVAQYVQTQSQHVQTGVLASSGIDTKYAPNGGYVY